MIQSSDLGMTPNDIPAVVILDHTNKLSYRSIRIAYDLTQFGLGVILGGRYGIGTLAAAVLTRPFIHISFKMLKLKK